MGNIEKHRHKEITEKEKQNDTCDKQYAAYDLLTSDFSVVCIAPVIISYKRNLLLFVFFQINLLRSCKQ